MSRFRYSGVNWEGRDWQVASPIETLGDQLEELVPQRFPVDGTVASRGHDQSSPNSDHRPDGDGTVRAIDFGGSPEWLFDIAEAIRLSQDPRVRYVIHDGRMYSSYPKPGYPPYTWRPYSGASPHTTHVHVSTAAAGDNDPAEWQLDPEGDEMETLRVGDTGWGVARAKTALEGWRKIHAPTKPALEPNDVFDEAMATRVAEFQSGGKLPDRYTRGVIGAITWGWLMEYVADKVDDRAVGAVIPELETATIEVVTGYKE